MLWTRIRFHLELFPESGIVCSRSGKNEKKKTHKWSQIFCYCCFNCTAILMDCFLKIGWFFFLIDFKVPVRRYCTYFYKFQNLFKIIRVGSGFGTQKNRGRIPNILSFRIHYTGCRYLILCCCRPARRRCQPTRGLTTWPDLWTKLFLSHSTTGTVRYYLTPWRKNCC